MFRTALSIAVLFLALSFAAQAKFVQKITEQAYVEFGNGGIIAYSEILVAPKWAKQPTRFELYLDLTEVDGDGAEVFLGSQQRTLSHYNLIVDQPDGPAGSAIYSADWSTTSLLNGSTVRACAQVFRGANGRAVTDLECRDIIPEFP